MSKFSERLKELREEKGLTQAQLAKEVKLSHSAIGHWETNHRVPNLDAVIKLAEYFKVTVGYMAGVED